MAVAVSADGPLAVSASWDKTPKVWDLVSGHELHTLKSHSDSVNGVAMIAEVCSSDDRAVVILADSSRALSLLR
jgi:WD40 repeat protein